MPATVSDRPLVDVEMNVGVDVGLLGLQPLTSVTTDSGSPCDRAALALPETVRPFPRAAPRDTNKRKKVRKSAIHTDRPEELLIEQTATKDLIRIAKTPIELSQRLKSVADRTDGKHNKHAHLPSFNNCRFQ